MKPIHLLLPLLLSLAACGQPRPALDPQGITAFRTYRFTTPVADPQPAWNPKTEMIVVRSANGFALLQEGQGRQEYFDSDESRQTWNPQWINRDQFVFGPRRNVTSVADGRVVAATDGLTVVTVDDNGQKVTVKRQILAPAGYRPRPGDDGVYAQVEAKMIAVDANGRVVDAGEGFYPEPQIGGPGLAWQETPIFETDRWTGKSGRGNLFIRWKKGVLSTIPGGCEARWVPGGGLVCTVLRQAPVEDRPWYAGGTDVWFIAGPHAEPRLVAKDARSADPHPTAPLIAVADAGNGVRVVSLRDPQAPEQLISASGTGPRWNHDGLRLLVIEPADGDKPAVMLVHVLKTAPTP